MKSDLCETDKQLNLDPTDELIIKSLAKLDSIALGVSLGTLFGLFIFLATNILILKGGEIIGPTLQLLSQFFVGYEVTFAGSFIGLLYGFASGYLLGWLIAFLRNGIVSLFLLTLKIKSNVSAANDFIDNP